MPVPVLFTAPPEVKNVGKTAETVAFPASNDSIIIAHFRAKSTGEIHFFGGKSIFLAGFERKSIQIHPRFYRDSRAISRTLAESSAESRQTRVKFA
jgi:hypothetical protein